MPILSANGMGGVLSLCLYYRLQDEKMQGIFCFSFFLSIHLFWGVSKTNRAESTLQPWLSEVTSEKGYLTISNTLSIAIQEDFCHNVKEKHA